jgi:alpha-tubulin suppressor-like RCC1 family protein
LSNVVAIAAGGWHTKALKRDRTVVAWGYNCWGQCDVPSGLSNVVAIAAGWFHTVALLRDGKVAVWGNQYFAPWEFEEQVKKGDLNGDNVVDISDVILVLRRAIDLD